MTESTKAPQIVKANASPDAARAFGVVCKAHPDAYVRRVRTIVVCAECGWTLARDIV